MTTRPPLSRAVAAFSVAVLLAVLLGAQTVVDQGMRAREEGRLDDAVGMFRRAAASAPDAEALLLLGETLAWQKKFDEAETVYREAVARFGPSRNARLGLGRVLLWKGDYGQAVDVLDAILAEDGRDADALEEKARARYWAGDFRAAERGFAAVIAIDPERASSRTALAEIRSAAAPAWSVRAAHRTDDQPWHVRRAEAEISMFSDPLTRWDLSAGTYDLDAGSAPFAGVRADIVIPSLRITVAPSLRLLSFPDGEENLLGGLRLTRKLSTASSLSLIANRHELLLNRAAAKTHPHVTDLSAAWELSTARGTFASARAGSSRYFDDNEGVFADGYVLVPVHRAERFVVSAGVAVAYRDTDHSRFRFENVLASPAADGFAYRWTGVYDPYWTPISLREGRAIASMGNGADARVHWNVQAGIGTARDKGVSFGPPLGTSPQAPYPFESLYDRRWTPWNASASIEVPAGSIGRIRIEAEHVTSIFYEADEFRAALVGRF